MGAPSLRRVRAMLGIVAGGLFISGVTIWPWEFELTLVISRLDGIAALEPLRSLLQELLSDMLALREKDSFVLYIADWLAFAHLILTALFLMAIRDPIRNVLVLRFGILCSLSVPLLAVTCVPLRGIPLFWILVDSSFALCAIPLLIALRDLRLLESQSGKGP